MVKYEKRIVCFIDILGFSSIIKSTISKEKKMEAQKALDNVCNALEFLRNYSEKMAEYKISTTQFSDSIVISFPWDKDNWHLLAIFRTIKYIQVLLLSRFNLLLRGGIVIGEMVHTDRLLVGPAMINAYAIESKCANSPRIVLDPKVAYRYNILKNKAKKEGYIEPDDVIHKDFDDTSYIDYFNVRVGDIFTTETEVQNYFKLLCQLIVNNAYSPDMSIRMKYLWMRNKVQHSALYEKPEYKAIYKQIDKNKNKND